MFALDAKNYSNNEEFNSRKYYQEEFESKVNANARSKFRSYNL